MSLVAVADVDSARRLTERIRLIAGNVADNVEKLRDLVAEAKASSAHLALGYESWTAYLSDVLGNEPLRLAREVRQELVAQLHAEGMSTRAIAPIVGVDNKTVHNDIKRGVEISTPESQPVAIPADPEPEISADPVTGELIEADGETEAPSVRITIGLDGKTYKTEKRAPKRASIIDASRAAGWELRKAAERLERLQADDRFQKNKVEILAALQPHLDFANEVITGLSIQKEDSDDND